MRKISFIMAAHNEEKIIGKTMQNLSSIPYENYEVLIGLDGCTDRTEEIVDFYSKKNKRIKHYRLNLRSGKPAVVNDLIKKATGEIVIINDADWIFNVKDKHKLKKLVAIFDDKTVGGIADSFPVEWEGHKLKRGNFGYKMVAYSSHYWLNFQKSRFSKKIKGLLYVDKPQMFLTNIFRKKLYKPNSSLGDDFERTRDIKEQGYEIVVLEDRDMPRMIAVYDKVYLKDLFKQKVRTAIARRQLNAENGADIGYINYYFPGFLYIMSHSFRKSFSVGCIVLFWWVLGYIATLYSHLKPADTKKGWTLRATR